MKKSTNNILDFLYKNLGMVIYVAVWLLLVAYFWVCMIGTDAIGYSLIAFYFILPISSFVVTLYYSIRDAKFKYYLPIICDILEIVCAFCTFNLANVISNGKWNSWNVPDFEVGLYSLISALLGLGVGLLIGRLRKK